MAEFVCYCHNFTKKDIENDALANGHSTIMEQIKAESQAGNCNCQENNPKGK